MKSNGRDTPLHLARTTATFTKFSSFVEVTQEEENEFVQGAIAELEDEVKESAGLVMIQAQERREVVKATDREKDTRKDIVSR